MPVGQKGKVGRALIYVLLEVKAERGAGEKKYRYAIYNPRTNKAVEWSLSMFKSAKDAISEGLSYIRSTYETGRVG